MPRKKKSRRLASLLDTVGPIAQLVWRTSALLIDLVLRSESQLQISHTCCEEEPVKIAMRLLGENFSRKHETLARLRCDSGATSA